MHIVIHYVLHMPVYYIIIILVQGSFTYLRLAMPIEFIQSEVTLVYSAREM